MKTTSNGLTAPDQSSENNRISQISSLVGSPDLSNFDGRWLLACRERLFVVAMFAQLADESVKQLAVRAWRHQNIEVQGDCELTSIA